MSSADIDTGITQHPEQNDGFADLYIDMRYKEKRILSDCKVMFLPDIEEDHVHYKEWQIRKQSSIQLIDYLKAKNKPLNILEVGCGNGWLSAKLHAIPGAKVTGIDVNEPEIQQAQRVFKSDNLEFICTSFDPSMYQRQKFDVILFVASIQYFKSLKGILNKALSCLKLSGEIHITDTNFYTPTEAVRAAKRSEGYFASIGFPEMAEHYFHHTINQVREFNCKVLCNPHRIINKITKKNPFYWIAIKH